MDIIKDLKQQVAFNRMWWSVLSIDKLVIWHYLSIERTGHNVVLKASSCLRYLFIQYEVVPMKAAGVGKTIIEIKVLMKSIHQGIIS